MRKKKKRTRTFKSRPKGYCLECCTKCLLSSRRSNLATIAQNWQANLPGFLRYNCFFFLPTKHLDVLKSSYKCVRAFQIEREVGSVGFWGEGETGVLREKPLEATEKTNKKLNPHHGVDTGIWTRVTLVAGEISHHLTSLACMHPLVA